MYKLCSALCLIIILFGCSDSVKRPVKAVIQDAPEEQFRSWLSISGKSIEAKLIDISNDGSSIEVEKSSGEIKAISVDRFCPEDRELLAERYAEFTDYETSDSEYTKAVERILMPAVDSPETASVGQVDIEPEDSSAAVDGEAEKTAADDATEKRFETWNSKHGKAVKAMLIGISSDGSSVKLEKTSGDIVDIPVGYFALMDREFLAERYSEFTTYELSSPQYADAVHRIRTPVEVAPKTEPVAEVEPEPKKSTGPSTGSLYRKMDACDKYLRKAENDIFAACRKIKTGDGSAHGDFNNAVDTFMEKIRGKKLPHPDSADIKRSRYRFYRDWVKKYLARITRIKEKALRYYNVRCGLTVTFVKI